MTPEEYDRVGAAYLAVRGAPADERATRLGRLELSDALRAEVFELLAGDDDASGIGAGRLGLGGSSGAVGLPCEPRAYLRPPERIGHYVIHEVIGQGGMGVVFRAEQAGTRREVAVKLIRFGLATPTLQRRFELEAQALGRLQHPGIAQIFEADTADIGDGRQPYFAMEYVKGLRLLEFARRYDLSTRKRLELILMICDAVQHAHQKGVIHRDIKPGNILVNEAGEPKILDFGIARLSGAEHRATTGETDAGQVIGTLAYMSPEQARGDPDQVDTQCDVYSLGVVAFELLSGEVPCDVRDKPIADALRMVLEAPPRRLGEASPSLDGDLEIVIGKALEKDKRRRYGSVAEFAADIRHVLRNEPITARPDSGWYVFRKLVSRHRVKFGVAAVFVLLVIGAAITIAAMYARQGRLLAETQREAARRKSISDFVTDMIAAPNPTKSGREVKVLEVLDRASEILDENRESDPAIAAALHETLGLTYQSLGILEPAEKHLRTAMEQYQQAPGSAAEAAQAENTLGTVMDMTGRLDEAEKHYRASLEVLRRERGPSDESVAYALNNLAQFLHLQRRDLAAAEPAYQDAIRAMRSSFGDKSEQAAICLDNYAGLFRDRGEYARAEEIAREALDTLRSVVPETDPRIATSKVNLAMALQFQQKNAEAENLYRDALAIRRKALGDQHPDVAITLNNYAFVLREKGDAAAGAAPLLRESLAIYEKLFGPDHAAVARTLDNLSAVLRMEGKHQEAEALSRRGLAIWKNQPTPDPGSIATSLANLGSILVTAGRASEAVSLIRPELNALSEKATPNDWRIAELQIALGVALISQRYSDEGEAVAAMALERLQSSLGTGHPRVRAANRRLDEARTSSGAIHANAAASQPGN